MKRTVVATFSVGALIAGAGLFAANSAGPSLPDVQIPAVQLSNAEGMDSTAAWLDLFSQTSGSNADTFGLPDQGLSGQPPLVVIEQQDPVQGLDGLFDTGAVDEVTSVINGPGAASVLAPNNGS